ncbi:hypothetical protein JKP88DRAFT_305722 [Tribonema minus]|uniref:RGS domain-containing protein n=1 Tax=Tribonema minus TaxID=303371 RepID=A0A835Z627_9STRA|nr:hypothetical protein JKP88DRAFT_305722 [Tribonema minus]
MWRRRKEMLVRARSPSLALFQGGACMLCLGVLGVQELFQLSGHHFPCEIMLWSSPLIPCMTLFALGLRAARVIIITSAECRKRFMFLLDPGKQFAACFSGTCMMCGVSAVIHVTDFKRQPEKYCMMWAPWWIWLAVMMSFTSVAIGLVYKLHKINDRLGLGSEVARCFASFYVFLVPYWITMALDEHSQVHVGTELQILVAIVGLYIMLEAFVLSRRYWGCSLLVNNARWRPKIRRRGGHKRYGILPEDQAATACDAAQEAIVSAARRRWGTTMQMLESAPLAEAYAQHVQQALCYESLAFLARVIQYSTAAHRDVEQQYAMFDSIAADFICSGSKFEVNISCALRFQVLTVRNRRTFNALSADARRDAFKPQAAEIAKMLDQNLVLSFQSTAAFREACLLQHQLDADTETLGTIEDGNHTPLPSPPHSPRSHEHLERVTSRLRMDDNSTHRKK